MRITDYCGRVPACMAQGVAEIGFSTGQILSVASQNIYNLSILVYSTIAVAFLVALEAEAFVHGLVPPSSQPVESPRLGSLSAEGLHYGSAVPCDKIDMALG